MLRLALRRQWVVALLVAIVGAVLCTYLGNWQWHKSQSSHGDVQNLVYSFNWWLFAALCIGVWGKALRDESRRMADPDAGLPGIAGLPTRRAAAVELATPSDAGDLEVDEWNAWLAELGSRDRRSRS